MDGSTACEECSAKCLLVHGQRDPSPIITSFFKVILGDSVSKALVIPPSFAKTIMSLVDGKTYLEDSTGQRWNVKVCRIGDKLVFQQGWHEFASDHSVESGDFVVFYYINGSHFVVQIYGRNGCEKLNISKRFNNSRSRTTKISSDRSPLDCRISTSSKSFSDSGAKLIQRDCKSASFPRERTTQCGNSHERSKPVLSKDSNEVPLYMVDRDLIPKQGANRISVFDSSYSEVPKSKSSYAEINGAPMVVKKKISSHSGANTVKASTTQETYYMEQKNMTTQKEQNGNRGTPNGLLDLEAPQNNDQAEDRYKAPLVRNKISTRSTTLSQMQSKSTMGFGENVTGNVDKSKRSIRKSPLSKQQNHMNPGKGPETVEEYVEKVQEKHDFGMHAKNCNAEHAYEVPLTRDKISTCTSNLRQLETTSTMDYGENVIGHGDLSRGALWKHPLPEKQDSAYSEKKHVIVKSEYGENVNRTEGKGKAYNVVKTEDEELTDPPSSNLPDLYCLVSRDTQLFLELPTNSPSFFSGGKIKTERKIVLLRDQSMRVWPVIYHERSGFRVLGSGWEALAEANSIQKGDICVFEVENAPECLFRLRLADKVL